MKPINKAFCVTPEFTAESSARVWITGHQATPRFYVVDWSGYALNMLGTVAKIAHFHDGVFDPTDSGNLVKIGCRVSHGWYKVT